MAYLGTPSANVRSAISSLRPFVMTGAAGVQGALAKTALILLSRASAYGRVGSDEAYGVSDNFDLPKEAKPKEKFQ